MRAQGRHKGQGWGEPEESSPGAEEQDFSSPRQIWA